MATLGSCPSIPNQEITTFWKESVLRWLNYMSLRSCQATEGRECCPTQASSRTWSAGTQLAATCRAVNACAGGVRRGGQRETLHPAQEVAFPPLFPLPGFSQTKLERVPFLHSYETDPDIESFTVACLSPSLNGTKKLWLVKGGGFFSELEVPILLNNTHHLCRYLCCSPTSNILKFGVTTGGYRWEVLLLTAH